MEKPARYLGGEQGATLKSGRLLTVALCFPDLYEIGMSNNALRILYAGLNALPGVRCERVFAPARDFEELLRDTRTPLYTLESGIPLSDVDILAFTIGYELSATNILTVLDLGGIPLESSARAEGHPVVIAGGPAVTNPLPLSRFLDAVWVGEAEAGFFDLVRGLSETDAGGPGRSAILARFREEPAFWLPGKTAVRAVDAGFPDREYPLAFPWPAIKPVQDHGTVEIMRGCPNGCRFCHAGYLYRPQRVRSRERIFREVEGLVLQSGYREITLSSLSSGDYPGIVDLVRALNRKWAGDRVSFQLPSLKVESFDLPVLEEIAHTRKSGLTFAVETPEDAWQRSINKTATLDTILAILGAAAAQGYRLAKFYFMVGLPVPGASGASEAEAMIGFLNELLAKTRFNLNVNIGTFIPKPHTPFQWAPQIGEEEAGSRIRAIRDAFRHERRIKISFHSPFVSVLEGILSRGDERVGELVLSAWRNGARLDAWEDRLDTTAWTRALENAPADIAQEALEGRPLDAPLPWDSVSLRVGRAFLRREWERSLDCVSTRACIENCTDRCGSCSDSGATVSNRLHPTTPGQSKETTSASQETLEAGTSRYRLVLRYRKTSSASFLPHHSVIDLFYRALQLARLPVVFSQGFNPTPRLEIEDPIPLGMSSLEDYVTLTLLSPAEPDLCKDTLNRFLPSNIRIDSAHLYRHREGKKNPSLSSMLWGSDYRVDSCLQDTHLILGNLLSDPRLEGSAILSEPGPDSMGMSFRLRSAGIREIGFGSLFERAFGQPFLKSPHVVTRIRQWADIGQGRMDFRKAFETLYGESP